MQSPHNYQRAATLARHHVKKVRFINFYTAEDWTSYLKNKTTHRICPYANQRYDMSRISGTELMMYRTAKCQNLSLVSPPLEPNEVIFKVLILAERERHHSTWTRFKNRVCVADSRIRYTLLPKCSRFLG